MQEPHFLGLLNDVSSIAQVIQYRQIWLIINANGRRFTIIVGVATLPDAGA
jgi:hypothetical protein